jgi:3-hydroxybutyryl-CoA dehydrogenase
VAVPQTVGVLGAGTMGAGIAQLAAVAGARTLLYDPVGDALERARDRTAAALERHVEKGRMGSEEAAAARERLEPVDGLEELGPAEFVIEAAPERLELKLELLGSVAAEVGPDCVLATNTSSLSVTEIAAGVPGPERVVGMHFFNPAPVMRLVEVVAGAASGERALEAARALGEAMGKHVVSAADVPGFLVNRCNRPYSLEPLKLAEERVAEPAAIDRVARLAGGFRMGPFELMDLIGIDTNLAVAEAFTRQSYGEPRYRPSPLAARMVAAGRLGQKTGRGWYSYEGSERAHRPDDPEPPAAGSGEGRAVLVRGELAVASELRAELGRAGWTVASEDGDAKPWLVVDFGAHPEVPGAPRLRHLHEGSLHRLDPAAAGCHLLAPLEAARAVELTATTLTEPLALERAEQLVASIGRVAERVGDAPGLVLGRVVAQLVNESAFLIGEGHASADDVDKGLELGVNHPRGPVEWSELIGLGQVVSILDALHDELGEERYRVAPLLRRSLAVGLPMRKVVGLSPRRSP